MIPATPRPHTGRRRNDAVRQAVLDATVRLLGADGHPATIDAIARAAGVGKQTIYRWWPSRGAILLEALTARADTGVPTPATGTLRGDLEAFLSSTFAAAQEPIAAGLLRAVVAEATRDTQVAVVVREFVGTRRAALRAVLERGRADGEIDTRADLETLIDQAYGMFWYRFLIGHAPLNGEVAARLAADLVRQANH